LYNGIDEKFIHQPTKAEKEKGKEKLIPGYSGEIVLISVANLVPFKDYKTTIDALDRLKRSGMEFHYFIIGDGPMRETIEKQISALGLSKNITITGKITNVKDFLQIGDIFIHSSLGEGCSNAILEAMAAGLPIIASDTGGTSEIAGEWNGKLFEYQNTDELTDALKQIMSNPAQREKLGQASFDSINEKFTIPVMVSNYYNIISQRRK
jgi:glycosyltransferase involved in cell wall biosynthesis